jgi:hypothetical protein
VLSGRRTYDLVNGWDGDHHDGVPMVILTHEPPETVPEGRGTYVFAGRPLFGHLGIEPTRLELIHLREAPGTTHLRFRVQR